MGADEFSGRGVVKKLADYRLLGVLASGVQAKIPVRGNRPVLKKAELLQGSILEAATITFLTP